MKTFKEFIVESPEDEIAANLARSRSTHNAEYPDGDKHGDAVYAKYKADKAAKAAGAPSKDPHGDAAMAKHKADKAANTPKAPTKDLNDMNPNERARHKRQVGYDLKAAQDKLVGVRATNKVNVGVANAVADVKQGLNNADIAGRRAEQTVATAKFDSSVNSLRNQLKDNISRSEAASRVAELALSPQSPPKQSSNETIGSRPKYDPNKRSKPIDPNKPIPSLFKMNPRKRPDGFIDGSGRFDPKKPRTPRDPNSSVPRLMSKQPDNSLYTKMSERISKNNNRPRA